METFVSYNVAQPCRYWTNWTKVLAAFVLTVAWLPLTAAAEADKVTAPLTDPARPGVVKVSLVNGSITVNAYDGKDVVIEARARNDEAPPREAGGMKRVPISATG